MFHDGRKNIWVIPYCVPSAKNSVWSFPALLIYCCVILEQRVSFYPLGLSLLNYKMKTVTTSISQSCCEDSNEEHIQSPLDNACDRAKHSINVSWYFYHRRPLIHSWWIDGKMGGKSQWPLAKGTNILSYNSDSALPGWVALMRPLSVPISHKRIIIAIQIFTVCQVLSIITSYCCCNKWSQTS